MLRHTTHWVHTDTRLVQSHLSRDNQTMEQCPCVNNIKLCSSLIKTNQNRNTKQNEILITNYNTVTANQAIILHWQCFWLLDIPLPTTPIIKMKISECKTYITCTAAALYACFHNNIITTFLFVGDRSQAIQIICNNYTSYSYRKTSQKN